MNNETIESFDRIEHILSELPFFEDFSSKELGFFSKNLSLRSVSADSLLFKEGDVGDYLFFVVNGFVEVKIESQHSSQLVLAKFGPGSSIGEMSLIDDYPRSASIRVSEPSELLLLSRKRLDRICNEDPVVGMKFLKSLARTLSYRLRRANGRFADIS
ncbi:MAG: cyclic nucleotide-binding domain-containing protein [Desulfobulbaceae bacterium]|nr:cyclic nucleotide-binding domain-containing protein [Desulfobulbaceae bacterium]